MLPQSTSILRASAMRVPRLAQVSSRKFLHVENTLGNNMPFSYKNKRAFAVKLVLFFGTGFSIPFIVAGYQLRKAGGAAGA